MHTKVEYQAREKFRAYLLFLLWPFMAVVHAIRNVRSAWVPNIIWFFCAFFGYTFIIAFEDMDAVRYKSGLEFFFEQRHKPYWDIVYNTFNKGEYSGTDIYSLLVTLTVSRFTDDFRVLFGIIGGVFGYFYSRNIFYTFRFYKERKFTWLAVMLLVTLSLLVPIWTINGYRFYTAAQVFFFGALRIMGERKYRYIWPSLLSPLFHFSFAFGVAALLIYLLVGNRYLIYTGLLVGSMFFTQLDPNLVNQNAQNAPEFMRNKVKGYSSKQFVKFVNKNRQGYVWYVEGHFYALDACMNALILYALFFRHRYLKCRVTRSFFSFGLLFLALSNFVSEIPSMGRFHLVALFFLCSAFIVLAQQGGGNWNKRLALVFFAPLFLYCLVEVRVGCDVMGLNLLFLNPMTAWFLPDSAPLISFFK